MDYSCMGRHIPFWHPQVTTQLWGYPMNRRRRYPKAGAWQWSWAGSLNSGKKWPKSVDEETSRRTTTQRRVRHFGLRIWPASALISPTGITSSAPIPQHAHRDGSRFINGCSVNIHEDKKSRPKGGFLESLADRYRINGSESFAVRSRTARGPRSGSISAPCRGPSRSGRFPDCGTSVPPWRRRPRRRA